jgi:CYTH domain-containing protein
MAVEIERKFLVNYAKLDVVDALASTNRYVIMQGYLSTDPNRTVRIRKIGAHDAFLTIKGITVGASRTECEYQIPIEDFDQMYPMCINVVMKIRLLVPHGNHTWEVDVFGGELSGLIVAEIELGSEDEEFDLPDWIDKEVTNDPRYFNSNLGLKGRP